MDVAYDHQFSENITAPAAVATEKGKEPEHPEKESLNEELSQAYKAISNSPWGARFGAFMGTVKKQGESYLETAKKEYPVVAEHATKGLSDLRTNIVARTRALSVTSRESDVDAQQKAHEEGLLEKLRKGASAKIAEIEAVEARADEYLIKFGSNIGNFLRDAITIAPPTEGEEKGEVVFEAKGSGENAQKQIFTTRLDAQLHLLHTNLELFHSDPKVESFEAFTAAFSIDKQTEKVSADLERYPELRSTMEKLVPGEVEYTAFWIRYYFLRNELDLEEQKRKEVLRGASIDEEEVGWDEDDSEDDGTDSEEEEEEKEEAGKDVAKALPAKKLAVKSSTDTLQPTPDQAKPDQAKSKTSTFTDLSSQPDSESSYDLVSGAPSGAPSQTADSPHQARHVDEDSSDEEADWE